MHLELMWRVEFLGIPNDQVNAVNHVVSSAKFKNPLRIFSDQGTVTNGETVEIIGYYDEARGAKKKPRNMLVMAARVSMEYPSYEEDIDEDDEKVEPEPGSYVPESPYRSGKLTVELLGYENESHSSFMNYAFKSTEPLTLGSLVDFVIGQRMDEFAFLFIQLEV